MNTPSQNTERPDYLQAADEVTHKPRDVPLWSENYLSQVYAPEAEIGFWFHLGRSAFDVHLWNEIFIAYLPGDQYLVASSFSYGECEQGPLGNQLHYRCVEPFKKWTKSFRGAANLVNGEELRAGPYIPRRSEQVEVELVWEGLGPVFDLGHLSSNDTWSSAHYEQHGKVRGYITCGGKRTELSGSGIRDHSWGPRDLSRFNTHAWMSGQFQDGRTFEIFHIVDTQGRQATHAILGDAHSVREAKMVSKVPLITDMNQVGNSYDIVLTTESGERAEIHADIIQAPPMVFAGASELLFGNHCPPTSTHLLFEAQTRYMWDGQVGYGLTDRSINLSKSA